MGGSESTHNFIYSIEVQGSEKPGESCAFVNPNARAYLSSSLPSGARTLYENFKYAARTFPNKPYLGTREKMPDGTFGNYNWVTYDDVNRRVEKIGWGLASLGLGEKDENGHSFLGIYSKNRTEWVLMDLACTFQNVVSVPIYDTLQSDALDYIVNQTGMKVIACADRSTANIVKLRKDGHAQNIEIIIQFDPVSDELRAECEALSIQIKSLEEVENMNATGTDNPSEPNSLFTLCYTSGTTGRAKGAMILQNNMILTMAGAKDAGLVFTTDDVHISYLPLAHMMERIVTHHLTGYGCAIGFFQGDVMKLRDDLAVLKPTIFVSVPRLFNRFYDVISQQLNELSGPKKLLANRGLDAKMYYYRTQGTLTHKLWDSLVFKKIRNVFGGRVRLMATGSAPISGDVLAFLRVVFSCPIVEGFGQTETCAATFFTKIEDTSIGIIGGPATTVEAKLVDVPDMNYFSTDVNEKGEPTPRGEICMRGPTVFAGYYKNHEQTIEAIDKDGWLHTGDVCVRLPHTGAFKIIDRKKNFFKLQQGEYVSAEKIEMAYAKSYYVSQIFVYGDSLQCYLVAIIVPDEGYIRKKWARENGVAEDTPFEEICNIPKLKADILADMNEKGKQDKLLGFEVVKKIHLECCPWTPADLLTPTQKLMRFNAKKKYESVIAELYKGN